MTTSLILKILCLGWPTSPHLARPSPIPANPCAVGWGEEDGRKKPFHLNALPSPRLLVASLGPAMLRSSRSQSTYPKVGDIFLCVSLPKMPSSQDTKSLKELKSLVSIQCTSSSVAALLPPVSLYIPLSVGVSPGVSSISGPVKSLHCPKVPRTAWT